jgi:hypothetical protein
VNLLRTGEVNGHLTPMQWIIKGWQDRIGGPEPTVPIISQPLAETLTTVNIPAGTELKDVTGDNTFDLVNKSDGKIVAANLFTADGSLTPTAEDTLNAAHIDLAPHEADPVPFQGTHTASVGHNSYHLPNGVDVADADGDGTFDDLVIQTQDGRGDVPLYNALTPSGTLAPDAQDFLEQNHFTTSTETGTPIIGTGREGMAISDVNGYPATMIVPTGLSVIDADKDGVLDHLQVDATGGTVPFVIDKSGRAVFDANAETQFAAAGVAGFDPNADITYSHMTYEQTIPATGPTIPDIDTTKLNVVTDRHGGWWDNGTPRSIDANGTIHYNSEGTELSGHLGLKNDQIRFYQDFEPPTGTSSHLAGTLELKGLAAAGQLHAHVVLHTGERIDVGTIDANGFFYLDPNSEVGKKLFHITEDGQLVPKFRLLNYVVNNGDGSLSSISAQVYEVPELPQTETFDVYQTVLDIPPIYPTDTTIVFEGVPQEFTLNPIITETPIIVDPWWPVTPPLGRKPLDRPASTTSGEKEIYEKQKEKPKNGRETRDERSVTHPKIGEIPQDVIEAADRIENELKKTT